MSVIAIDPGTTQSAWVELDLKTLKPVTFGIAENQPVLEMIRAIRFEHCAIEMIASYGMPVGAEVFETCVWIGRFLEARWGQPTDLVFRREVKLFLCGNPRAKDPNIRQALIDRYGPGKRAAIGLKAEPGPLYGFRSDLWAALGVAVTWADQNSSQNNTVGETR